MRVVVVSDSHGDFGALERIVRAQPEAGAFFHLGDGEREFQDLCLLHPDKFMAGVAGNCDWGSDSKRVDLRVIEKKRIFFAHGHTFGVKSGLGAFIHDARGAGAHIALYGHTHRAHSTWQDGMYILNPGSVSQARGGAPSYGVIDITPAGIAVNIVPLVGGGGA